jgi:hypothetical protein
MRVEEEYVRFGSELNSEALLVVVGQATEHSDDYLLKVLHRVSRVVRLDEVDSKTSFFPKNLLL